MNAAAHMSTLYPLLPEIVLGLGAMALLMLGAFAPTHPSPASGGGLGWGPRAIDWLAIVLLIAAGVILYLLPAGKLVSFNGSFVVDNFARFLKILALAGSAAAIAMSLDYAKHERQQRFEYAVLIVLSTLGMMMLISAADLIALYLGLELMSLPLYVVAASHRDSLRSTEAGLKYFVLGALSSGMLLYGASLVYGFTGTVSFAGIAQATAHGGIGLIFGLVFLFAGFCFKVSAVPFHMWTPDVYEGAPTPVTAFFAAAPKVAGIAMFVRATVVAFPGITAQWQQIVVFVAIASMLLGSFAAIGQRNIKRLMAYSSIGHMGFALIGLAAGTAEGVQGVLVYMAIYLTMTLGVFAVILSMRRSTGMVESIDQLAGLARTNPTSAFFMAMLLFSMAGIPPLAGFFAKFYVFLAAIKAGLYILAVIGVLASVVGAYYYLAIIKIMYFDDAAEGFYPTPVELKVVLAVCGLFNVLFFLYPGPLVGVASAAARSLF
jgi:NADH-quinone oxidoreductase subunit N